MILSLFQGFFFSFFSPLKQSFLADVTLSFAVHHFLLATPRKIWLVSLHWLTNGQQ